MTVLVAGGGPVARALLSGLDAAGLPVATFTRGAGRGGAPGVPEVAILAVGDAAIGQLAAQLLDAGELTEEVVLLHCAGALAPRVALSAVAHRVAGVGLLHPLRALPRDGVVPGLAGTVFGVAGDERGRAASLALVAALGGVPLPLDEESLPRYHAAAVLAGNHTLGLLAAAVDVLVGAGLERRVAEGAAASLLRSAADNVAARGVTAALTGPLSRGDVETVAAHLAALPPAAASLYRATGCATLEVAEAQGRLDAARLRELQALLGCVNTNDSQSKR